MRETGYYKKIGEMSYFIPNSLPPEDSPLEMTPEIIELYGQASLALGQLNEMSHRLPDQKRFIKAYVIKEALLSSSIEGIHTTIIDIFTTSNISQEARGNKETQLVLNYTKAIDAALEMIQEEDMPITTRLILKAHEALMNIGDNAKASPGIFRAQSVRVGSLTPPPANEIPNLMSDLEKYINIDTRHPGLIKTGLAHVQFETIHPFLDGNGRIGRLLIVLMLIEFDLLKFPCLYPSYYFKKHHMEYYQRLDRVRTHGDFEGWIIFYLKAIIESARDAYIRAKEIENLEKRLKDAISQDSRFSKMRSNAISLLEVLFRRPVSTISEISEITGKSYNSVAGILHQFVECGFVSSEILNKRNKLFKFTAYLDLLEKAL